MVTLDVFDILGRRVARLVNDRFEAGNHEIPFAGSSLSSGVYLYRLSTPFEVQTKKMLLVK
jgi:hypothetical protein